MSGDSAPINLTNHFLIAMPGLEDMAFARSVVYVCEHSKNGAVEYKTAVHAFAQLHGKMQRSVVFQTQVASKPHQAASIFFSHGGR